jgi:hypothetical protein
VNATLTMTNTQLHLALGVPIIAVITSLMISLIQISGIRDDMRGMRSDFRQDLHGIRSEFHEDLHSLRSDVRVLTGKVVEIDNRLTRIEERLEHR